MPDGEQASFDEFDGQANGKGLLVTLAGLDDRDQARAWLGAQITVPRSALPEPDAGEFYWADLEGLEVVNQGGVALGRIDHLVATGANDVMVVRDADGRERLLPFVIGHTVREVDLGAGRVLVDWDADF